VGSTLSKPATKIFNLLRVLIHEYSRFVNNAGYVISPCVTQRRIIMISLREKVITLSLLPLLLLCCQTVLADQAPEELAVAASEAWLSLVDEGRYATSWNEAAQLFKGAVAKEQWEASLRAFRIPLGRVISRELKSSRYTKTLPGAPDGEYVVIQYETSFEKKKVAIETVTPMLDKDGVWRVSGYYIK